VRKSKDIIHYSNLFPKISDKLPINLHPFLKTHLYGCRSTILFRERILRKRKALKMVSSGGDGSLSFTVVCEKGGPGYKGKEKSESLNLITMGF